MWCHSEGWISMTASSRSRLTAAGITLLVLLSGLSDGRLRPAGPESGPAAPPTFFVTRVDDDGPDSLRQAILDANARPNGAMGPDRSAFAVRGDGVHTIAVLWALPAITEAVVLDGYPQEGARANARAEVRSKEPSDAAIRIVIDGAHAGDGDGLVILAGDSAVRGLAITGFGGSAIRIDGGGHSRIEGNLLGARPKEADAGADDSGTEPDPADGAESTAASAGNGACGVTIVGSSGNVVGGLDPAARNVIRDSGCGIRIAGAASTGNALLGNSVEGNARGFVLGEAGSAEETERSLAPAAGPGPNRLQAAPSLLGITRPGGEDFRADEPVTLVEGALAFAPGTTYRIELFASDPPAAAVPQTADGEDTAAVALAETLRQ